MSEHHMTPEEFREYGKQVVDWVADYYKMVETYPVLSQVHPGEIRSSLPETAPQQGESIPSMLADLDNVILPGVTHWQSPNFFAYYPCNASGPGILGEIISAGLNVQGMNWVTSPACSELEAHVLDWLVDMLDLPKHFKSVNSGGGVIQDSASSATVCAAIAARERATGYQSNAEGLTPGLIAYLSDESNSSVEKALRIIGIGSDNIRFVPTNNNFEMDARSLNTLIRTDIEAGLRPFFVCATVGTTSTGSVDPIQQIGEICAREALWLHVDAAMAGSAALCPEYRTIHEGLEFADSYCFNPHKWMFTNFDCDCFYVKDRNDLTQALTISPEYLRNIHSKTAGVDDYRNWQIPLGRRFRALKLWFVIRYYGVEGLQKHIRDHVALAQLFKTWVDNDPDFQRVAPAPLQLVCFAHVRGNDFTQAILDGVNQSGAAFLSHTVLNGQFTIRISIGQTTTQEKHVKAVWNLIRQTAANLNGRSEGR